MKGGGEGGRKRQGRGCRRTWLLHRRTSNVGCFPALAPHQTHRDALTLHRVTARDPTPSRPAEPARCSCCLSSAMTTSEPSPTMATRTPLQLRRITAPDDENLGRVLALSNAIFSTVFSDHESTKRGSMPYWRDQLSHPSSFIIYLAPSSEPDNPVAFLFVTPRAYDHPLKSGAVEGLHVWLAGVSPEWRAAGCLTRMVCELGGIDILTICTHPSLFPLMWRWLTRRGWLQEQEFADGKVMFSRPEVI